MSDYSVHYSDTAFWKKIRHYAVIANPELIEKALILYYCLIDPSTANWAKAMIAIALGYFILPFDGVPDFLGIPGYVDDLAFILSIFSAVIGQIRPEHQARAQEQVREWLER
ncbi:MAG TPA: YkvA family protein [Allocoleopsis sp.]